MLERARSSLRYGAARAAARLASGLYRVRPLGLMIDVASLARLERTYGRVRQLRSVEAVFERMLERVDAGRSYAYLEFGVYQGRSLRWWSTSLTGPEHVLVGFDSFEGLPEAWNSKNPTGHFDRGGAPPKIDDDRVSFRVGWFDDTVPAFDRPGTDSLIVNVDCDLYSSTKVVLDQVGPWLRPGDLLYFDEFGDLDHEYLAWLEFTNTYPELGLELVAVANGWRNVAFRVTRTIG